MALKENLNLMTNHFPVFLSNRLETLYEFLKISLFKKSDSSSSFTRRMVVVYGPAMQNWILLRMASDPELRVATGLEILHLNQAFPRLLDLCHQQNLHPTLPQVIIPSPVELALAIEQKIHGVIRHFHDLSTPEKEEWAPLIKYVNREQRILALSEQLAQLFYDYGRYGGATLETWEKQPKGWQQLLWSSLFHNTQWSYFYREFQKPLSAVPNTEVHFFSLSFVTDNEWKFLCRLSDHLPIHYYLLSPCTMFWSDIRSDRECSYLLSYWQEKVNNSSQLLALEELLSDRNPLLANFGRLGREMVRQIEESAVQISALYYLEKPSEILSEDLQHEDLVFIENDQPLTLLQAIQADILLMRNPALHPTLDLSEDDSIQVHMSHNKRREVETLYHTLMGLIDKKQPHLSPGEIIVMAPDIMEYTPYIESVFGSNESALDFQILDVTIGYHNEIFRGFFDILSLGESRWEASQILQLFSHPAFQRCHQFSVGDYDIIKTWIEKFGIRWGENQLHRNEILERDHCTLGMVDETEAGTWNRGFNRLLLSLTTTSQLEFSQSELLGKWIKLIKSLRDDLTPLQDGSQLTLNDWMNYFHCLLDAYLKPNNKQQDSMSHYQDLKNQIDQLKAISRNFKEDLFSYQSIKSHFMNALQKRKVIYRENHLQTIRFCSMVPLRLIPAKVIAMIGMKEDSFPRISNTSTLNILEESYFPLSSDADRYLFLEVLQSSREHLILSYSGYDFKENREAHPSLVIQELLSYLDKYYSINSLPPSKTCFHKHPFDAHDSSYFKENSAFHSYFMTDFIAAKAHCGNQKNPRHCFIEQFEKPGILVKKLPEKLTIDLKHLSAVARNPIKFHLNHTLGIYLENREDRQIKDEEKFQLSHLDFYLIKHAGLKEPLETLLLKSERKGQLPTGLFKQVAIDKIEEELADLQLCLNKHGIFKEDLFQIEFSAGITHPIQSEDGSWKLPAIKLDFTPNCHLQIIGKVPYVSSKGLIGISKGSLPDIWKLWPSYLLYHYATCKYSLLGLELSPKQLILTHAAQAKNPFFTDAEPQLKRWIEYYFFCVDHFSPLIPDWTPFILSGDTKGLEDKLKQLFSSFRQDYQSPELQWVFHKERLPNADLIIENWREYADMGPNTLK